MELFPAEIIEKLRANGVETLQAQRAGLTEPEHRPVVKVFAPWGRATWLLSEIVAEEDDLLYGLCDLGMGSPELGYVAMSDLLQTFHVNAKIKGRFVQMPVTLERDLYWKPKKTLREYAQEASEKGMIQC